MHSFGFKYNEIFASQAVPSQKLLKKAALLAVLYTKMFSKMSIST